MPTPTMMARNWFALAVCMSGMKMKLVMKDRSLKIAIIIFYKMGDSVILIKDLKVKGSSLVLKKGTKIKNIKLVNSDHNVDCKIEGQSLSLKSEFLKKA